MVNNKQNKYKEYIRENKILKTTINGLYRFIVLWIIKNKGIIHGYGIMKELDNFFLNLINDGALKKSNPSKIYPILKEMEKDNLITSSTEYQNDKEIKYYQITEKGEFFIRYILEKVLLSETNPKWQLVYADLISQK